MKVVPERVDALGPRGDAAPAGPQPLVDRLDEDVLDGGGTVLEQIALQRVGLPVGQHQNGGTGGGHHACVGGEGGHVPESAPVLEDEEAPALGVSGGGGVHGGPEQLGEFFRLHRPVFIAADAAAVKQFLEHRTPPCCPAGRDLSLRSSPDGTKRLYRGGRQYYYTSPGHKRKEEWKKFVKKFDKSGRLM